MKAAYRGLTVFFIIWIIANQLVTIALPKHEYIAATLADEPGSWTIDTSEINRLERYSEEEIKEDVVTFLNENRTPTYTKHGYLSLAAFLCLLFTVVGWIRESRLERTPQQKQELLK